MLRYNTTMQLERGDKALTCTVVPDPLTSEVLGPFDLDVSSPVEFLPWQLPALGAGAWRLGVIVGASGSGKSTLLREFGKERKPRWRKNYSIASHFADAKDAIARLNAVGLNSVPVWRKPYEVLSTGERFRADLARQIGAGAVVDEYTSTVSRSVACAASRSLRKWLVSSDVHGMVLATCHRDVLKWLSPDWIIDTDAGKLIRNPRNLDEVWTFQLTSTPVGSIKMERR